MILTIIILGAIFGLFFSFDLFISPKRNGTFIRQFVCIITTSIPAIYNAVFMEVSLEDNSFPYLWIKLFYPSFACVLLLSILISYIFIYNKLINQIEINKSNKLFTYLDFIYKGYHLFKKDLEDTFKEEHENRKIAKDTEISQTLNKLRIELVKYISDIYQTIDDADIDGYMGFVLYGFVRKFMGECDARFTIRQLDLETNKMYTVFTTKGELKPGDINIKKNNLITKSIKLGKPILYSENKKSHFKTINNSIAKGIYDDYVSYCLLKTEDGRPYYSICLDVKGEYAKQKLKVFVDSLVIEIICNAITLKLIKKINHEK